MANKILKMDEVVQKYVKKRSMIVAGGFPMCRQSTVFAKEILRQNRKGNTDISDLIWIEPGIGYGGDMLIAEGVIDTLICSYTAHERPGLSRAVKNSLEKGIPRKIKLEDETNLTLVSRLAAGALNIPFFPSSSGIWGDVRSTGLWDGKLNYNKNVLLQDPYGSGKQVALLQALKPDLAVIHVPFADEKGNGIILGSIFYDYWIGRCAKDIVLVADRIVDSDMCRQYPNLVTIPGPFVAGVVPWYMAAWPTNSPGMYGQDLTHSSEFIKTCKDQNALREYLEKYVYSWDTHEDYLKLIDKKDELEDDPAKGLSVPYQQWIKY